MRKILVPVTAALLSFAASAALAAEFQPFGAVGIGGAGVARTTDAYAGYWNPAGLAFHQKAFTMPISVGAGLRVSKGLADNVDRLSRFTEEENGESVIDRLENLDVTGSDPQAVSEMVDLLSVIDDIEKQKGTLSINANAVVAMQVKRWAFGAFGTMEGFAQPRPDLINVLPTAEGSETVVSTPRDFYAAIGAPVASSYTPQFFTQDQLDQIAAVFTDSAFGANALSASEAAGFSQEIDRQMAANPDRSGLSNQAITNTVTTTLRGQMIAASNSTDPSTAPTIDNNKTAVMVKSLAYVEFPLSYGHPFDFGRWGKLGIGGSIKVIRGRVYQSRIELIEEDENDNDNVGSDDILDNFSENFEESNAITVDLGALWKYSNWLSVGVVAKNLTSPKFKSPELKNQDGISVDEDGNLNIRFKDEDVELKPQVRLGVAVDPFTWLTVAADLDITENDTVLSGLGYKSRHLGGGFEVHPFTWFKLRGGIYTNLSNSDVGPVATGGLTFGLPWVNLELDGAYGLNTAEFDEKSYPKEARVQGTLNIQF